MVINRIQVRVDDMELFQINIKDMKLKLQK